MPFEPKPIAHGTGRGFKQETYRGIDPCDECRDARRVESRESMRRRYQADPEHRRKVIDRVLERERMQRRTRRVGKLADVIVDHVETLSMVWGLRGVSMAILVDSITDRHPDATVEAIRRTVARMVVDGRLVAATVADERRYRLHETGIGV